MDELFNSIFNRKLSVTVVGDTLIDEYYSTNVSRVSPEFPIPVMRSYNSSPYKTVCGGASNVATQFKYLNTNTNLISILNFYAKEITQKEKVNTDYSLFVDPCHVPVKKRFYHDDHPIMRWDVESTNYGLNNINNIIKNIKIPESDVVIFSDYDKGLFNKKIKITDDYISLVDPKNDMSKWRNCTVFKPNYNEACKLTGETDITKQINKIVKNINCKNVIITKSGEGVYGWNDEEGYIKVLPTNKIEKPESVIGAGDCFMSFLALGLGNSFSLEQSLKFAFKAGRIYVSRKYNQPLCISDFYIESKIISNPLFLAMRNFKLAMTNGCFDVMHKGHIHSLKEAKKYGDKLCVAINSDASIKRNKGTTRPILPLESRIEVMKSIEFVDFILVFDEDTPENILSVIKPDVYVKGSDYKNKELHGSQYAKRVVLVDLVEGFSTSKFVN